MCMESSRVSMNGCSSVGGGGGDGWCGQNVTGQNVTKLNVSVRVRA